ncbi:glycoside hydrolase family 2 protein [Catenulispora subtropica]|uniref:beta-mannosidase n=1 Tax=Catenulispora subtropica TaxID=450798 RepID=A0ABN2SKJ8_9ACTN
MHVTTPAGWTVRAVGGDAPPHLAARRVPATVPGCVHLDLLAADLIPDPYLDANEALLHWIGRTDWRYEAEFHVDGEVAGELDLVAHGLDTVAEIEVNGRVVAATRNMHRSYRIPVAGVVRPGRNELAVTFAAPVPAAERFSAELGELPQVNTHPFNAIRKMACSYGWDWGPDVATSGIWRPLELEAWNGARIAAVRPLVAVDGNVGTLTVHVDVQRASGSDSELTVLAEAAGVSLPVTIPAGETSAVVKLRVPDVRLWWPVGYGEQPLYDVEVTLSDAAQSLDTWAGRVGFRTVALDVEPDADGTPFTLSVNGRPVFARGVNWIPDDAFPSRITRARLAERLTQARDANVNLVRIWGGGIYESEDFYDLCDRLGLLVWQDFLFACGGYAEEEPLRGEVIAEAREAVTRLTPHPSLILWNGCNENIWGYEDWDWKPLIGDRTWGWGYYTEILPAIVAELDPTRPYSAGSPYSFTPGVHPNDPAHGTMHIWEVWNREDYTTYRDYRPRFVSEFGFQGPPTWATLTRAIHDEPRRPDSPAMLVHQKAEDGNGKLERGLAPHLPRPRTFEDWHWATSLNQARAISLGIDHFRSLGALCSGTVLWQLNDMWPVTSWAAIDGDGRRKPLWYAMRRSFADRLLTFQPRAGGLALVAVNDSDEAWTGGVMVTRRGFDGSVLDSAALSMNVAARSTVELPIPHDVAVAGEVRDELLVAEGGGEEAFWFYAEDVESRLPAADLAVKAEAVAGGYQVTVTAGAVVVRDLAVLADRVAPDAVVDDMLLTLLPGRTAVFTIATAAEVDPEAFASPLVLRSANQLLSS